MSGSYLLCFMACLMGLWIFKNQNLAPEVIRKDGPKSHFVKLGTPTMAGVCFMLIALVWMLFMLPDQWLCAMTVLGFMLIGAIDDWVKIKGKQRGLSMKMKMLLLLTFSAGLMYFVPIVPVRIPWADITVLLDKWAYVALGSLVLTASANAMNFTDGVDGLCATQFLILWLGMMILFLLNLADVKGLLLSTGYVAVAVVAFLYFNAQPAQMFMGDSGSLPLGALIGLLFMHSQWVLYLPWIGLVLVLEVVSVMIQIISFKTRGVRVFKMAPLHHHFELLGWSNMQIVLRFLLATLLVYLMFLLSIL